MRVTVQHWRGKRTMDLADALTIETPTEGGSVERALDLAESNAKAMGKLLAALVEKKTLTLDEAGEIVGEYSLEEWDDPNAR